MSDPYTDLVCLATGILDCLEHGDLWTKDARVHAAAQLRTTLARIHDQESPPPDAVLPAWLQRLPDNPQLRAAAERALSLETERPHDWIRGIANDGKP